MFGGWRTSFTIGYGLPLQDYLFQSEGKRFLNFTFGSPMNEVVVDNLTLKVPANIFEYRHFTYLRLDSFTFAMLG